MSVAEIRANKLYNEYHLDREDGEVKRNLSILLLMALGNQNQSATEHNVVPYTIEELHSRVAESEAEFARGEYKTQDDVNKEVESLFESWK